MNETVNQEENKTFTQEEVNAIVSDRLSRERSKYSDYEALRDKAAKYDAAEEASKTELQKAQERANTLQAQLDKMLKADQIRVVREKVASEKGVPAALLSMETEEDCIKQADAILSFAKPGGYPKVKDGGEARKPAAKQTTREQFADWFDKLT